MTYDANDYDVIAYGSPVYASNVSPILEDSITSLDMKDKKGNGLCLMLNGRTAELDTMIS